MKGSATQPVKLARTGIEYPFMVQRPRHNDMCHTYEPIGPVVSPAIIEEHARIDAEKAYASTIGPNERIVYDCIEYPPAPSKKDAASGAADTTPYIDENDLVELQQEENPVDQRKYYPYGPPGQQSSFNPKVMKLNRYYTKLRPYYTKENEDDTTLIFESRFESGNLRRAQKIGDFEYNLFLRNDYNTTAYTQWYYFRITNIRKGVNYKFNIVNMLKPDSSFNHGLKPLVYSKKEGETNNG